jgi:hypothetical protein
LYTSVGERATILMCEVHAELTTRRMHSLEW